MGQGCSCEDGAHEKDSIKHITQGNADMLGAEDVPSITMKEPAQANPSRNFYAATQSFQAAPAPAVQHVELGGHVEQPRVCKDDGATFPAVSPLPTDAEPKERLREVEVPALPAESKDTEEDHSNAEDAQEARDAVPDLQSESGAQEAAETKDEATNTPSGTFTLEATSNGAKLGCFLGHKHQSSSIEVLQVLDKGIVPAWNQLHPDKQVTVGCLILAVNDVQVAPRGRDDMLQDISGALRKPNLKLLIQRSPQN
mmetsp:Transcript_15966/g.37645  ORF Transcript_15966/g.37645 Transcript_15966/m.37645 type:complete len:255 (+) Transcript_15966:62-826(+)